VKRNVLKIIKRRRKDNRIGHILHRTYLVRQFLKDREREECSDGQRGRRLKQLLDDLKEKRGHCTLKEKALDRTVWRTRFGRGYGLVRQTSE
jgi:hypothetical protein